jgi:hypothetical protein
VSDNITLPRAVGLHIRNSLRGIVNASDDDCGEEKCRDCAPVRVMREALAALDAALAEPDAKPEPVHPGYIIGSHWLETAYSRIAAGEAEADVLAEVLGARGWVKPEPATEAELSAALTANHIPPGWWFIFNKGFRAAERFHGITKEDK